MTEKSGILYSLLSHPLGYRLKRALFGGSADQSPLMGYLRAEMQGLRDALGRPFRLLDVGCGEGGFARHVAPFGAYVGLDMNERYIAFARANYAGSGEFICDDVRNIRARIEDPAFDAVMMKGVLHHLDDALAADVVRFLFDLVPEGGFFLSIDPVLHERQNPIARVLVSMDRGAFVRAVDEHKTLFPPGEARHCITNFLKLPYSHVVSMKGRIAPPLSIPTRAAA